MNHHTHNTVTMREWASALDYAKPCLQTSKPVTSRLHPQAVGFLPAEIAMGRTSAGAVSFQRKPCQLTAKVNHRHTKHAQKDDVGKQGYCTRISNLILNVHGTTPLGTGSSKTTWRPQRPGCKDSNALRMRSKDLYISRGETCRSLAIARGRTATMKSRGVVSDLLRINCNTR
jgi:hypothetical protein